ncbi:hypothetical protein E4U43_005827 [Claviceps pusilla]|uniref:Uncharacterized protein n=1 Tax=Claviceps pusilla TaxID=123648 RepID=A0A9P7SW36_9HYPO|nr:hypothetical protein E4U43_005827 [Claviceps pusilla]
MANQKFEDWTPEAVTTRRKAPAGPTITHVQWRRSVNSHVILVMPPKGQARVGRGGETRVQTTHISRRRKTTCI